MSYNKEKYCSQECQDSTAPIGVCDFCQFYDFNGDEDGAYTGDGYCNYLKQSSDPSSGCDEFICMNVNKTIRNNRGNKI